MFHPTAERKLSFARNCSSRGQFDSEPAFFRGHEHLHPQWCHVTNCCKIELRVCYRWLIEHHRKNLNHSLRPPSTQKEKKWLFEKLTSQWAHGLESWTAVSFGSARFVANTRISADRCTPTRPQRCFCIHRETARRVTSKEPSAAFSCHSHRRREQKKYPGKPIHGCRRHGQ